MPGPHMPCLRVGSAFLATGQGQHGAADLRIGPEGRLSGVPLGGPQTAGSTGSEHPAAHQELGHNEQFQIATRLHSNVLDFEDCA
eukprot:scaffold14211_cov137-Isochrysis_galbana.AAC.3